MVMRIMVDTARANVKYIIFLFLFLIASTFFEIYPIRFMESIIDNLTMGISVNNLLLLLSMWYGFRLFGGICTAASGYFSSKLQTTINSNVRSKLFERILRSPFADIERASMSESVSSSVDDVNALASLVVLPFELVIQNILLFTWASIYLISIDFILFIACLPLGLLMWLSGDYVAKKNKLFFRKRRIFESEVAKLVIELVSSAREILSFKLFDEKYSQFNEVNSQLKVEQNKSQVMSTLLGSVLSILWPIATVIALGFGGFRVTQGELTIGGLIAFMWYVQWAIHPVSQLSSYKNQIQSAKIAYERVEQLFNDFDGTQRVSISNKTVESIQFKDVDCVFDNNRGIHGVTLNFEKGNHYSIVGKTGSGKSTIIKVLMGLYSKSSGCISINGKCKSTSQLLSYNNILATTQNPYIFASELSDNINLKNKTDNDNILVKDSISKSCLEEIYNDSSVALFAQGDHGISSGQKQRIGVARLFFANPNVVILDEALSAVDSSTTDIILTNLLKQSENHITITISHRLSDVLRTDFTYFIDDGIVINCGRPKNLLQNDSKFRELFSNQLNN